MKTAVASPGPHDPTRRILVGDLCATAMQAVNRLATVKSELVIEDPALQPLLDAIVDDFVSCARMTIDQMAEEGGNDDACE